MPGAVGCKNSPGGLGLSPGQPKTMAKRKKKLPVATEAYKQRSAELIEAAQGEPMLLRDIAKILKTTYGGAAAQMTLLRKCGLPVPEVERGCMEAN